MNSRMMIRTLINAKQMAPTVTTVLAVGNALMRGRMIDPQVGQRNRHQDQPRPEKPLVEPVFPPHLTT